MPVRAARKGKKPGFKYGKSGKVYTYTAGNKASKAAARKKAEAQGAAIRHSQERAGKKPT